MILKPISFRTMSDIRFRVILIDRKVNITINEECSLEDLYLKIYDTIYPGISQETSYSAPKIYQMAMLDKDECSVDIPVHRFITISAFMKTKPGCFENIAYLGTPLFLLFVIDEKCVFKIKNPEYEEPTFIRKFTQCVLAGNLRFPRAPSLFLS